VIQVRVKLEGHVFVSSEASLPPAQIVSHRDLIIAPACKTSIGCGRLAAKRPDIAARSSQYDGGAWNTMTLLGLSPSAR